MKLGTSGHISLGSVSSMRKNVTLNTLIVSLKLNFT